MSIFKALPAMPSVVLTAVKGHSTVSLLPSVTKQVFKAFSPVGYVTALQ